MISWLLNSPLSYIKYFLSQYSFKFKRYLLPKNITVFISNHSVRFHGNTAGFLGHHKSHQLTVEFLNLLYILSLVCSIHQTLSGILKAHINYVKLDYNDVANIFLGKNLSLSLPLFCLTSSRDHSSFRVPTITFLKFSIL